VPRCRWANDKPCINGTIGYAARIATLTTRKRSIVALNPNPNPLPVYNATVRGQRPPFRGNYGGGRSNARCEAFR